MLKSIDMMLAVLAFLTSYFAGWLVYPALVRYHIIDQPTAVQLRA